MSINFLQSLRKIDAIKEGTFTLKSGKNSNIYLDLRKMISHPALLRTAADKMWEKIHFFSFDLICGVPYTALPIATCISVKHNIPMIMRRKEQKNYGMKQKIEGTFHSKQTCVIVEDVITTGSSILETIHDLKACELNIKDIVVLVDREEGGKQQLENQGYHVHAVYTLSEILQCSITNE